jgi:hypothetical protein
LRGANSYHYRYDGYIPACTHLSDRSPDHLIREVADSADRWWSTSKNTGIVPLNGNQLKLTFSTNGQVQRLAVWLHEAQINQLCCPYDEKIVDTDFPPTGGSKPVVFVRPDFLRVLFLGDGRYTLQLDQQVS